MISQDFPSLTSSVTFYFSCWTRTKPITMKFLQNKYKYISTSTNTATYMKIALVNVSEGNWQSVKPILWLPRGDLVRASLIYSQTTKQITAKAANRLRQGMWPTWQCGRVYINLYVFIYHINAISAIIIRFFCCLALKRFNLHYDVINECFSSEDHYVCGGRIA